MKAYHAIETFLGNSAVGKEAKISPDGTHLVRGYLLGSRISENIVDKFLAGEFDEAIKQNKPKRVADFIKFLKDATTVAGAFEAVGLDSELAIDGTIMSMCDPGTSEELKAKSLHDRNFALLKMLVEGLGGLPPEKKERFSQLNPEELSRFIMTLE
jgi:hypothetical protein